MQIKNRFTGEIIIERDANSIKELVEWCAKNTVSLFQADLKNKDLSYIDLSDVDLSYSDLNRSNLSYSDLTSSNLSYSDLSYADLSYSVLSKSNLRGSDLSNINLSYSNLRTSDLSYSILRNSDLSYSDLSYSILSHSDLKGSDLCNTTGLVKIMCVERGNFYYKRIGRNLVNFDYQFKVGINTLNDDEVFAGDERVTCSYPGFHFASKSWCALQYPERPYEAKIRIPDDAQINEPWATDGKASADKIEIVQVIDTKTGEDVTERFRW